MAAGESLRISLDYLRRAQAGDREALNKLVDRYYARILRLVRARLGKGLRARIDSLDVAQNTLLKVVRGLPTFEPKSESSLINWISRLIENEIRDQADFHRAAKRDVTREVSLDMVQEGGLALNEKLGAAQPSISQWTALKEDVIRLESALDQIGKMREVIILRDYSGMSFKEIGAELDVSEDAARMRYVRAMNKLTDILAKVPFNRSPDIAQSDLAEDVSS